MAAASTSLATMTRQARWARPAATHGSPRTTHHAPRTTHHAPLATHHSLLTTHFLTVGQALAPHTPGGPRVWTLYVFLAAAASFALMQSRRAAAVPCLRGVQCRACGVRTPASPAYRAYLRRAPEAQGSLAPGGHHCTCAARVQASGVPYTPAYRVVHPRRQAAAPSPSLT